MASRGSSRSGGGPGTRRRPQFYVIILAIGFVVGGLLQASARRFLPPGAVKEFLSGAVVNTSLSSLTIDLVILRFAIGPVALDVSLLSLLGVLIAYLIARSLF
jgi:hypothetical protein